MWESFGYELKLWTEQNLPLLRNQRIYDDVGTVPVNVGGGDPELGTWVQRADIAAYELVWLYGGIYANCDIEPLRSLDDLLDGVTAFAGREDAHAVCNALMGATPHHPFFDAAIDALPARWSAGRCEPMNLVTGPKLLTDLCETRDDLTVFPRETFYPFNWLEMSHEWDHYPHAYTRHHWGHTRGRWSEAPDGND